MLSQIDTRQILYIDIETVPAVADFDSMDPVFQQLWDQKMRYFQERDSVTARELYDRAAIHAEFGKIVCISTAVEYISEGILRLRVKSFFSDDENALLTQFAAMLNKSFSNDNKYLCGHNVKEFDAPYLARRMLIHGIPLPKMLNTPGKKPWEVNHIDTLELWKFGDYKHYTSLNLLAAVFGIPTPKDDISGADVGKVYWEDRDLERIKTYCEKDTVTVAHLLHKFKNLPLIPDENIESV